MHKIAYHSLAVGVHEFHFDCDSDFFNRHSGGVYPNGDCSVDIELHKGANLMTLNISASGEVECECDRCLDMFMVDTTFEGSLFVKFSQEVDDPTFDSEADGETDIMWMNPADNYIELGQYIYESIILSLPSRRIHPDDENGNSLCDPDMMMRFAPIVEGAEADNDILDEEDGY